MSVYVPSITNDFKGKIKYGKDFAELLEQELNGGLPSAFPPRKSIENVIPVLRPSEYHSNAAVFDIEGKIYTSKVSGVLDLVNEKDDIGSCFKMKLQERKSKEEILGILSKHAVELSDNSYIRYFQIRNYNEIMDPEWLGFRFRKKKDIRLFEEINTPKRVAYFTVLREEDEDGVPIHKGQRIIPKRLTQTRMAMFATSGYPYEFFAYPKKELEKYPLVEIR